LQVAVAAVETTLQPAELVVVQMVMLEYLLHRRLPLGMEKEEHKLLEVLPAQPVVGKALMVLLEQNLRAVMAAVAVVVDIMVEVEVEMLN
jgi:hypothetical protein